MDKEHTGTAHLTEQIKTFEARWRYAVFPAMLAFVILAAFGFYLIYGMLMRMEDLSGQVERMTGVIEKSMPDISQDIRDMNATIAHSMPAIEQRVAEMSQSTRHIAVTTGHMGDSVWEMNRNVSSPMAMMSNMVPFFGRKSAPKLPRNWAHSASWQQQQQPAQQMQGHAPEQGSESTQKYLPAQAAVAAQRYVPAQAAVAAQRYIPAQAAVAAQRYIPAQAAVAAQRYVPAQAAVPVQVAAPTQRHVPVQVAPTY